MELVEQLRKDGTEKGLCSLWQKKLRGNLDTEALVRLYIKGIDFCVKNDYPTLDFLRENFKGNSEPYGVYIDEELPLLVNKPDLVLNGACRGELAYNGYSVSRVVVRHTSHVTIDACGYAHLTIDVFDEASLKLTVAGTNARVLVNRYGNADVEVEGVGVKVVFKNKNTY